MQKASFVPEKINMIDFESIVPPEDIELISGVSNYDCNKLIKEDIPTASRIIMEQAFGKESHKVNVVDSYDLNKKGLQLLRAVAFHNIMKKRRVIYGLDKHKDYEEFKSSGAIIKENFLPTDIHADLKNTITNYVEKYPHARTGKDTLPGLKFNLTNNKQYQDIMNMCTATKALSPKHLSAKAINHTLRDHQHDLHIDKIYPTIKVWYYINDTSIQDGPTYFVKGSHKNTQQKLNWLYKKSLLVSHPDKYLDDYGTWFWSRFRPGKEEIDIELEKCGFNRQTALTFSENTLIMLDTSAFHRRGEANTNTLRVSLRDVAPRKSMVSLANSIGLDVITK
jgi:hypothetical protein